MVDIDGDWFSEGGTAQGAYSPLVTPPTHSLVTSGNDRAQHTSDGNDQHSSRDARDDCAVGRGPAAGASADATAVGQDDPQALHASSRLACAHSDDNSGCPHDHGMHASPSACPVSAGVAALSAPAPHSQGARSPLASSENPSMHN